MKKLAAMGLAAILAVSTSFTAFAGTWKQDNTGWWYQDDNGSYPANTWRQIDGAWYYFTGTGYMSANQWIGNYYLGSSGAMLTNTTTPDGYMVGADGAWIQDSNGSSNATLKDPVYLKDIKPTVETTGITGKYFALDGENSATWYYTQSKEKWYHFFKISAPSQKESVSAIFPIGEGYSKLTGKFAPSDDMWGDLEGTLYIYGDNGKLLYTASDIGIYTDTQYFDLDISGQKSITFKLQPKTGWGAIILFSDVIIQ